MTGSSAPRCRTKPYTVPAQASRNRQGFNHSSHIRPLRRPCAAAWRPFLLPCPHALPVRASCGHSCDQPLPGSSRSEEHTSELQSLMRISYAVFCLKKKTIDTTLTHLNTL